VSSYQPQAIPTACKPGHVGDPNRPRVVPMGTHYRVYHGDQYLNRKGEVFPWVVPMTYSEALDALIRHEAAVARCPRCGWTPEDVDLHAAFHARQDAALPTRPAVDAYDQLDALPAAVCDPATAYA